MSLMNNQLNNIKKLISNGDFCTLIEFFKDERVSFEDFVEQKIYLKILKASHLTESIKNSIRFEICLMYQRYNVDAYLDFVQAFLSVSDNLTSSIKNKLFSISTSVQDFYSLLDDYYSEIKIHNIPLFAIKLLCDSAIAILPMQNHIKTSHSKNNMTILGQSIDQCLEYGSITELFDDVTYQKYLVHKVSKSNESYYIKLEIKNLVSEKAIKHLELYEMNIANVKIKKSMHLIPEFFDFYKCSICKKVKLLGFDKELIELLVSLIDKQCSYIRTVESFFFYLSDLSTAVLSIYFMLYVELLVLCFDDSRELAKINFRSIRSRVLFGDKFTDEVILKAIDLLSSTSFIKKGNNLHSYPSYLVFDNSFLIYRWMLDNNTILANEVMDMCISDSTNMRFGSYTNSFGKEFFEKLIRHLFERNKWIVVDKSINIKGITDVDLIAYRNGAVIIGQAKLAHTNYSRYNEWKAIKSVENGILQSKKVKCYFDKKPEKLRDILSTKGISKDTKITNIVYIVITSNNTITGYPYNGDSISVIGCEVLDQILLTFDDNITSLLHYCENPIELFNSDTGLVVTESKIQCDEYCVTYEEVEVEEAAI